MDIRYSCNQKDFKRYTTQETRDEFLITGLYKADGSAHPFHTYLMGRTPAGRWGKPEDLAGPAVFLSSDASDFVNGQILYVDGGIQAYFGKQP